MPPSVWDVQPYRSLTELRKRYTAAISVATRNQAFQMAPEAEQWMKDNAPWQDRDIWRGRGADKVLLYPAGHARSHLRAYVVADKSELRSERMGLDQAQAADRALLQYMNQQIKELVKSDTRRLEGIRSERTAQQLYDQITEAKEAGQKFSKKKVQSLQETYELSKARDLTRGVRASRLKSNLKRQKKYKKRTSVPVGESAVKEFEAGKGGRLSPIVSVKFTYQRDKVPYDIWLEVANGGRYGILSRTLDHWGRKFMNRLRSNMNLIQNQGMMAISSDVQTPQQQFAEHARSWEQDNPGQTYAPWTKQDQLKRRKRRKSYDPEAEKKRRERTKAYFEAQRSLTAEQVRGNVTRGVGRSNNPIPETRTLNLRKLGR